MNNYRGWQVQRKQKKDNLSGTDATEVPYVTSTNADNPDMEKTPAIHGILLGDVE